MSNREKAGLLCVGVAVLSLLALVYAAVGKHVGYLNQSSTDAIWASAAIIAFVSIVGGAILLIGMAPIPKRSRELAAWRATIEGQVRARVPGLLVPASIRIPSF